MTQPYPQLADFLAGWFHQDFDIAGSTLDEILAAYRNASEPAERLMLRHDIRRFLDEHAGDAGAALEAAFDLEVDPLGFADSAEAFLQGIDQALADS